MLATSLLWDGVKHMRYRFQRRPGVSHSFWEAVAIWLPISCLFWVWLVWVLA